MVARAKDIYSTIYDGVSGAQLPASIVACGGRVWLSSGSTLAAGGHECIGSSAATESSLTAHTAGKIGRQGHKTPIEAAQNASTNSS
jgi:hypothetical protein